MSMEREREREREKEKKERKKERDAFDDKMLHTVLVLQRCPSCTHARIEYTGARPWRIDGDSH